LTNYKPKQKPEKVIDKKIINNQENQKNSHSNRKKSKNHWFILIEELEKD